MAKEDNLKPFKKGQSGNPAGRAKGTKTRATILKEFFKIQATIEDPETKKSIKGTLEDKIVMAQLVRALTGDTIAFREVMDSVYGKIPTTANIDHTTDGEALPGTTITFDVKNMTDEQLRAIASGKG